MCRENNSNTNIKYIYIYIYIYILGLRAQIIYWALSFGREREQSEDERKIMNGSDPGLNEQGTNGKVIRGGTSPWI